MRSTFRPLTLRLFAGLIAALMLASDVRADDSGAYDRAAMMRAIAENWLATQQPDGLLPYGFDFLTGEANADATSSGYIAREAGASWVWARYYAVVRDPRYVEPLRRGMQALAERSIPFGKPRAQHVLDALRIYDLPFGRMTLTHALRGAGLLYTNDGPARALTVDGMDGVWTGGTALALLAELEYARATGDQRFAAARHGWRDALLALHVPARGFRASPVSIDDDDFATAEAWLALATYADADPQDSNVRRVLADLDDALVARFTKRPNTSGFQWTALAALQRFVVTHDPRWIDFAREQSRVFLARLDRHAKDDPFGNRCGSIEGMAAMHRVLAQSPNDGDVVAALDAALARETSRLPRMQITAEARMPLGGEAYLVSPARARFAGAFLWKIYGGETRVDAAAHCLSALLLMEGGSPANATPGTATNRTPQ